MTTEQWLLDLARDTWGWLLAALATLLGVIWNGLVCRPIKENKDAIGELREKVAHKADYAQVDATVTELRTEIRTELGGLRGETSDRMRHLENKLDAHNAQTTQRLDRLLALSTSDEE